MPSFETAARDCYDALKEGWKNRRYANWISSFENHVFPHIGTKPVDPVNSACVVTVLSEEASLRSVSKGLPRQTAKAVHLEAMPYAEAPALPRDRHCATPSLR